EIISHAVWRYHVFSLSLRDVELILAERGVFLTYETVRRWCRKFGESFAGNCGGSGQGMWEAKNCMARKPANQSCGLQN
ncbi:MAG: IS6 family transposase, partial [Acidobacteriaceae bacterium]|nr:IS6 family transposase [Acidobacteriaceae bacterium]